MNARLNRIPARVATLLVIAVLVAGCGSFSRQSQVHGSRHTVRVQQPPTEAAACFARNAEEHSSALIAEVNRRGSGAEVIVRVKNGVLYGSGEFQAAGSGSTARIMLMVTTTGRRSDLLDALLEGC